MDDQQDDNTQDRVNKLLRRLREEAHGEQEAQQQPPARDTAPPEPARTRPTDEPPEPVSVSPFTLDDVEETDLSLDFADLPGSSDSGVVNVKEYLKLLGEKMRTITQAYSEGKINQAQFQAVYTRYREQREIAARIARRNPDSDAWQRVAQEGHTDFLLKRLDAQVTGIVVLENRAGGLLRKFGRFNVAPEVLMSLLDNFRRDRNTQTYEPEPVTTQIEEGRWLALIQGKQSTSVVLFSSEPPQAALAEATRAHREFERLNVDELSSILIDADDLKFPQEGLLSS
ncbi:MAG: hypothetical protein ACFB51_04405 [Anaerolineae bacterium]